MGAAAGGDEFQKVQDRTPSDRQFRAAYPTFDRQDLGDRKFVYLWADGIYLKAGLGTEKARLMVLIGADTWCVRCCCGCRKAGET